MRAFSFTGLSIAEASLTDVRVDLYFAVLISVLHLATILLLTLSLALGSGGGEYHLLHLSVAMN